MKKNFFIIDGSCYIYKSYYANDNLKTYHKKNTGTIRLIVKIFKKIVSKNINYNLCILDSKKYNFRSLIYNKYKKIRKKIDMNLIKQMKSIFYSIRSLGLPIFCINGFEADDIIGTLTKKLYNLNFHIFLYTVDKDFSQLVRYRVNLINNFNYEYLDEIGVLIKFGIIPRRIIDYLMLAGDSVDNIPGVKNIGKKIAVKLIKKYKSLNDIVLCSKYIRGIKGLNIRKNISYLLLSHKLVSIKLDCCIMRYNKYLRFSK